MPTQKNGIAVVKTNSGGNDAVEPAAPPPGGDRADRGAQDERQDGVMPTRPRVHGRAAAMTWLTGSPWE